MKIKLSTSLGKRAFTHERVASLQALLEGRNIAGVTIVLEHNRLYECIISVQKDGNDWLRASGDDETADAAAFKAIVSLGDIIERRKLDTCFRRA